MPTGELLMFHGEHDERVWTIGEPAEDMRWLPVPHHVTKPGTDWYPDIFCSGHVLLPNGHPLIAGGNIDGKESGGGLNAILSFNPFTADPDMLPYGWTEREKELVDDRWYPTLTMLSDGQVLISGGASRADGRNSFELYDPIADSIEKLDIEFLWGTMSMYPLMFLLPNGDVLYAGGEDALTEGERYGRILVPGATAAEWWWAGTVIGSTTAGGSAVMYAPGKIMKSGGITPDADGHANAITEVIDLSLKASGSYPSVMNWDELDPMNQPRHFHTLTLLPDGRVLATGGNMRGNGESGESFSNDCYANDVPIKDIPYEPDSSVCPYFRSRCIADQCEHDEEVECEVNADCGAPCTGTCPDGADCVAGKCVVVIGQETYGWTPHKLKVTGTCDPKNNACFATKTAEIWDSCSKEWTELDEQEKPRMYHSTAVLMPDGRVLSTGGGHRGAVQEQPNVEYFEPVYGTGTTPEYTFTPANDPALTNTAPYIYYDYGWGLTIINTNQTGVASATLVKLAAVTHGFDQGQMIIPLNVKHLYEDHYSVSLPTPKWFQLVSAITPPGFYMLFVQTSAGAISTGQYVRVGSLFFAGKWSCEATQQLIVEETVCDTTPVNGECPSGYESQEPVPLPVLNAMLSTEGWEVVAPPGSVEDPQAPSTAEIDSILAQCTVACEQQWAGAPEISANCASSGVFETPDLVEVEDVYVTQDLIPAAMQDGSGIFISEFTSQSLNCTLGETCCQEFDELLCNATNYRPTEASAPQGGPAEYEVSLSGTSTLTIGAAVPAVISLSGEAAYGFCASEASGECPFYLDRFEATNTGTTQVRLDCDDSSSQLVDVTDLEVRLVQPAFGIEYSGYVGFPPGGLIFETTLEVDSVPYSYRRPITASVIGTAEDDDFELTNIEFDLTVPCNTSKSTVTVSFDLAAGTATASPPTISIVLPSSPPCSTAMDLDAMTSDPDDDIVSVRWRMDGVLLNPALTQVVPTGSHTLTAIAIDARGATTTTTEIFQCN